MHTKIIKHELVGDEWWFKQMNLFRKMSPQSKETNLLHFSEKQFRGFSSILKVFQGGKNKFIIRL